MLMGHRNFTKNVCQWGIYLTAFVEVAGRTDVTVFPGKVTLVGYCVTLVERPVSFAFWGATTDKVRHCKQIKLRVQPKM